jgi:hypothetical protein
MRDDSSSAKATCRALELSQMVSVEEEDEQEIEFLMRQIK